MGKGKAKGFRPPAADDPTSGMLYGSAAHLTGNTIASPVQLRQEGIAMPKEHMNFDDEQEYKGKGKGKGKGSSKGGGGEPSGPSPWTDGRMATGANNIAVTPRPAAKEAPKQAAFPTAPRWQKLKKEEPQEPEEPAAAKAAAVPPKQEPAAASTPSLPSASPALAPVKEEVKEEQQPVTKAKTEPDREQYRVINPKSEIERRREAMLQHEKEAEERRKAAEAHMAGDGAAARPLPGTIEAKEEEVEGGAAAAEEEGTRREATERRHREEEEEQQEREAKRQRSTNGGDGGDAGKPQSAAMQQGLQRWAERVNVLAGDDTDLMKRCREFVRKRILKAHAMGNLHSVNWDEEAIPTADDLRAEGD